MTSSLLSSLCSPLPNSLSLGIKQSALDPFAEAPTYELVTRKAMVGSPDRAQSFPAVMDLHWPALSSIKCRIAKGHKLLEARGDILFISIFSTPEQLRTYWKPFSKCLFLETFLHGHVTCCIFLFASGGFRLFTASASSLGAARFNFTGVAPTGGRGGNFPGPRGPFLCVKS